MRKRNNIKMNCLVCGRFFWVRPYRKYEAKFCNPSCAGKYLGKLRNKGNSIICVVCGKEKHVYPAYINQTRQGPPRYCSQKCLGIDRMGPKNPMYGKFGELNPAWNGGTSFIPYGREFNKRLKETVRARDNYTCQHCGVTDNGGKKMCVHHIDYNKNNNDPKNLISLCSDCHHRTNGNRQQWKMYFSLHTENIINGNLA